MRHFWWVIDGLVCEMTDDQAGYVSALLTAVNAAAATFDAGVQVTAASDRDLQLVEGEVCRLSDFLQGMLIRHGISPVEDRV